jgi:hypothetical protein
MVKTTNQMGIYDCIMWRVLMDIMWRVLVDISWDRNIMIFDIRKNKNFAFTRHDLRLLSAACDELTGQLTKKSQGINSLTADR